jgi:hypothetical protein
MKKLIALLIVVLAGTLIGQNANIIRVCTDDAVSLSSKYQAMLKATAAFEKAKAAVEKKHGVALEFNEDFSLAVKKPSVLTLSGTANSLDGDGSITLTPEWRLRQAY